VTLSKFLTYWSLLFAILTIWGFSVLVALADVKDDLVAQFRKRWSAGAKNRLAAADPLAGRSIAETLTSRPMTELQAWVLQQVTPVVDRLGLQARTLVLEDSQGHFVLYVTQGKRLVTYRVDKAWVADARAGKTDQLDRIRRAVEQYLRQEFLGESPAPKAAPAPAAAAPPSPQAPATPDAAEMTREEKVAAAKARAAQRVAAVTPPPGASAASGGDGAGPRPQDAAPPPPPSDERS